MKRYEYLKELVSGFILGCVIGAVIAILIFALLFIIGCADIRFKKTLVDGTVIEGRYTRILNQKINDLYFESPTGWLFGFGQQESDLELGFRLGVLSVQTGGVE